MEETVTAIISKLSSKCPVVFVQDEQVSEKSVSDLIMKNMEEGRVFLVVNLSAEQLHTFEMYGSNSTSPAEILHTLLHSLYRKSGCYIFIVWVKDPTILCPEGVTIENINHQYHHHPGWRRHDKVILIASHLTRRYRSLIQQRIWGQIPNIIALKKNFETQDGQAVNIFTVLPYFTNGRRKSQEIDIYLVQEKVFLRDAPLFFEKFANLYQFSISLGIIWKEPFFIWGNKKDPYLDGLDWRLFQLCKDKLNFTFHVQNVNTTGRKIGMDWNGMLGLLYEGIIDVGLGGVSITSERRQYFDFCRTYYTDSYNFIAPLNSEMKTALNTFLRPLSSEVWAATLITIVIGIITLKVVATLSVRLERKKESHDHGVDSHFNSICNNCGFIITVFCQKPYRYLPKAFALQAVYFGMILMTFLLGMAFSSCLISVVLGFKPKPIADTLDEVLKVGLPIAIKNYDGSLNEFMNTSGDSVIKTIFEKATFVNYYESVVAMDEVVRGKMIYIDSKAKIQFSGRYRYASGKSIKFHISSESVLEFDNLGWPVNNNWPLTMMMDGIISRAVEGGIVQHWMSQFQKGRFGTSDEAWKIPNSTYFPLFDKEERAPDVEISENNDRFVILTRAHISGVYVFYLLGVLLSFIIFICECVIGIGSCLKRSVKKRVQLVKERKIRNKNNKKGKRKTVKGHQQNLPELVWNDFVGAKEIIGKHREKSTHNKI